LTEDKKILLIEKEIKVATYDIDFAGIVSNISYIRWLEDLRLAWLEKYFPWVNRLRLVLPRYYWKLELNTIMPSVCLINQ